MCTLILLDRVVPGFPLVVAANRDEFFARPSASPAVFRAREEGRADFVAPQDLEAGGTWMGVNSHGLFVGLTNRSEQNLDPDRRSRGLLVRDRLGCRNASEAIEELGDPTGIYNPFFLAVADGRETWWVAGRPEGAEVRQLEPGIHVAGNRDVDDPSSTKVREIHGAVKAIDLAAPFGEVVRGLVDVLSAHPHTGQPVENACVHTPEYGTRSASVIALGPQRRGYWATDGAPCKAKFQDCTRLLDEIQLV